MKYVGNFKQWVNPRWITEILNNEGLVVPRDLLSQPDYVMTAEDYKAIKSGYNMQAAAHSQYDANNLTFNFDKVPGTVPGKLSWWIIKMLPGQLMPMHTDPVIGVTPNITRYWMPWTDWEPGHIFAYRDTILANYKVGDLFEYTDPTDIHGAVNIGTLPRITFNIGIVSD